MIALLRVVNVIVVGVLYLSFCSVKGGSGIVEIVVVVVVMTCYWL